MNETLAYIIDKWDLNISTPIPIQIPNSSRTALAQLFRDLGYRVGAEIGTLGGDYAKNLKKNNPDLILYCIDPWEIYDGIQYFDQNKLTKYYNLAMQQLNEFKDVHIIKKKSMDAVKEFKDNSLDFVYIDANHELPFVIEDLFYWSKKVKPGGIISGHDYLIVNEEYDDWQNDVKAAVKCYTETYQIKPFFVMDEGTIKRTGTFLWVKP